MAEEARGRRGWLTILLSVAAVIALGFATYALMVSWRAGRSDDARRVRDLAIAARNIQEWPENAEQIGRLNLYNEGLKDDDRGKIAGEARRWLWLHHPDLADFRVEYFGPSAQDKSPVEGGCDEAVTIAADRMTVKGTALSPPEKNSPDHPHYVRLKEASWFPSAEAEEQHVCFSIADLDLRAVTVVPEGFEHLLLARTKSEGGSSSGPTVGERVPRGGVPVRTGEARAVAQAAAGGASSTSTPADSSSTPRGPVVAQMGDNPLPIRELADLPDVRPQLLYMAQTVAQAASGKAPAPAAETKRVRLDALEPLDSTVAGTSYRFYFYPVTLREGGEYLLVGAVRQGADDGVVDRLGVRMLAVALALLLLASLTPTLKLALLGPVDGIKRVEAGALVFGLLAAVALATGALIVAFDVVSGREAASHRLRESAAAIRDRTAKEISDVLLGESGSVMGELTGLMPFDTAAADCAVKPGGDRSLIKSLPDNLGPGRDFRQPDSLFPIARSGRQPVGIVQATARDAAGGGWELGDRPYFRRAVDGDFAPRSHELVTKMAGKLKGVWRCVTGGLVFDQVRSRPDGVPKTIVAAQIGNVAGPSLPPGHDDYRDRFRVLGVSTVLKSLLSPPLHKGERFAVLDGSGGAAGLRVLFHSVPGRAGAESFTETLDARAKGGLAAAMATRVACAEDESSAATPTTSTTDVSENVAGVEPFGGEYEGTPSLFAAARLPCTDWVIITFIQRDIVDGFAAQAGVHAMLFWAGGLLIVIILFLIVNAVKRAMHDRPAWLWLWPDPARREQYRRVLPFLWLAALSAGLVIAFSDHRTAALIGAPSSAALIAPALAGAVLYAALLGRSHAGILRDKLRSWDSPDARSRRPMARLRSRWSLKSFSRPPVRRAHPPKLFPMCSERPVLDTVMEAHVRWVIALMVLCICVLPMVALSLDARAYFHARQVGDDFVAFKESRAEEVRRVDAVALTFREAARSAPAPMRDPVPLVCSDRPDATEELGLIGLEGRRPCFNDAPLKLALENSLTASARHDILSMDRHILYGDAGKIGYPRWRWGATPVLICLAVLLATILLAAFRSALRGLFGFGVVLEAVPYPSLPIKRSSPPREEVEDIDIGKLPPRFVAVAAPDHIRRRLEELADQVVDLFTATEEGARLVKAVKSDAPRLILFRNLETLMRNRSRRLKALELLERLSAEQGPRTGGHGFIMGLVSDLSPLDRLLMSYERDAEDLQQLSPEERHAARVLLAGEREDVRWSRLFESFTTYTYCAARRAKVDPETLEPEEREAVRVVEREVQYLPDHAVAAVIPDERPPLEPREIAEWAKSLKGSAPRAIHDFLTSQFIEHYQLVWSISSHAERLVLHRLAHRQTVNIGEAYALRSLVRRGLVVLDPVPRLMNDSFAKFIRHAEEPRTLTRWRKDHQRSAWQILSAPLMIALPFGLGVMALIAIRSGESMAALLPLVVSVGPALVNFLSGGRRAAG